MIKDLARRFRDAFHGVSVMIKTQPNAKIHLLATVVAVAGGIFYRIELTKWLAIILAITTVWAAEAINTAIELLADAVHPSFHPLIGKAKDIAAGAVLVLTAGALIIGIIVFKPYIIGK